MIKLPNNEITHVVLCDGDIETLGFFSNELAKSFRSEGMEVFVFDLQDEIKSIRQLAQFCIPGKTAFVTFNYTGLIHETCFLMPDGQSVWDAANIYCINIVVDHPFYYHRFHSMLPKRYFQYCIDLHHLAYLRRFFPEIKHTGFLPLAGTQLKKTLIPYEKRSINLIFTGNYSMPQIFTKEITSKGKEYEEFYRTIIDDLISHPNLSMEKAFEIHIKNEIPDATDSDLKECMCNLIFIDLYVRFYYRGKVIQTLADAGHKITLLGSGWHNLECKHPENLICYGSVDSRTCLEQISNSKISLNIMPWFKQGAHDRIFNSMLNGSVCVSDTSEYLKTQLIDQKDLIYYHLESLSSLPDQINFLLTHPSIAKEIAQTGYETSLQHHTWKERSKIILANLKNPADMI